MLIEKLKLTIKKLRHDQFGQSSERGGLLDQLELQLAHLEENTARAETAAQIVTVEKITVSRRKPARRPLPAYLPRERIVYPAPATMQADAYAGFTKLYGPDRKGGPITEAACWAHASRKFFDLARLAQAPTAVEAVKRIDLVFAIEREINGRSPQERGRVRQERSRPLTTELRTWFYRQRTTLSKNNDTTKAINYILTRWDAFTPNS